MNKYGAANFRMCGTLLFLCTVSQCTFAEKSHWNPSAANLYHSFKFPKRTKESVSSKIDYQGWNFAGRGEFPYLVEIRGNNTEDFEKQEEWSNGNLVSSKFILTVCIAVVNFKKIERGPSPQSDPLYDIIEQTYLSPKNPKYYKVLYSDDYTYKSVGNGYYTGTRQVKRLIPHPKCNHLELDYQWGIVEIKRPIWPVPPWTSYMPIDFKPEGWANIKEKYVSNKVDLEQSAPCSVGLWSRKLAAVYEDRVHGEWKETIYNSTKLWNYKIKYAVFPADPRNCWDKRGIDAFPNRVRVGETIEEWECMAINSNETIGTVCDRDRGAPIVCDGIVRGIVLTGAVDSHCNIATPMPFLMLDIRYAYELFSETSNIEWTLAKLKNYLRL